MRKEVVAGVALCCVEAFVYLAAQIYLFQIVAGANYAILPGVPWFVIPLAISVYLSSAWPVRKWSAWPIFWTPKRGVPALALILPALLICLAAVVIPGRILGLTITTLPVSPHATESLIASIPIALPVFAAFTEEIGFRGILQGRLERYLGPPPAIAVTTVAYVLAHFGTPWFFPEILFYVALSVECGILASRARSVLPGILLHFAVNAIGIIGPLVWGPIHLRNTPDAVAIPLFFAALLCIWLFRKMTRKVTGTGEAAI
ncbi:MAG TPA: type II CAAX endopeptidase family protein [Steroidobacteraceae bacterium]|nr:type II CAAX endopeptidase family protein [Steroidobacteraceae bacterium]